MSNEDHEICVSCAKHYESIFTLLRKSAIHWRQQHSEKSAWTFKENVASVAHAVFIITEKNTVPDKKTPAQGHDRNRFQRAGRKSGK